MHSVTHGQLGGGPENNRSRNLSMLTWEIEQQRPKRAMVAIGTPTRIQLIWFLIDPPCSNPYLYRA